MELFRGFRALEAPHLKRQRVNMRFPLMERAGCRLTTGCLRWLRFEDDMHANIVGHD